MAAVQLFHYHLVTSRVREVEARYVGKLGFDLVARHGRIGEELTLLRAGRVVEELDARGFKLRLTELEKGAVNVVVQPGQWPVPRVDHLGLVLDDDEFEATLDRAERLNLRIQEHGGRRTFVSTNAGYRLEIHPPRDWIEELLAQDDELRLTELHLKAEDPAAKANALAEILDAERARTTSSSATPSSASSAAARRAGRSCFGELFVSSRPSYDSTAWAEEGRDVRRRRRLARDRERGRRAASRRGGVDRRERVRRSSRRFHPLGDGRFLAASTDGVGTKLILARQRGALRACGADLAAHCINDVITCGAEPLVLLDYVAAAQVELERGGGARRRRGGDLP